MDSDLYRRVMVKYSILRTENLRYEIEQHKNAITSHEQAILDCEKRIAEEKHRLERYTKYGDIADSVDTLNLPVRTTNGLKKRGLSTIGDVMLVFGRTRRLRDLVFRLGKRYPDIIETLQQKGYDLSEFADALTI